MHSLEKEQVIVVDDDPMILDMICDGLAHYDVDATPVLNPVDALRLAETVHYTFAILDYDLQSPEMNGIQLGEELKNLYPEIVVILMTGYHNIKIAVEATRKFAFDHMIKPFRIDQLLSMMERSKREWQLENENKNLMETIHTLREEIDNLKAAFEEMMPLNSRMGGSGVNRGAYKKLNQRQASQSYERQKNHQFPSNSSEDKKDDPKK